jgi:hypothetical protein
LPPGLISTQTPQQIAGFVRRLFNLANNEAEEKPPHFLGCSCHTGAAFPDIGLQWAEETPTARSGCESSPANGGGVEHPHRPYLRHGDLRDLVPIDECPAPQRFPESAWLLECIG